jgi:hypothetical protein
MTTVEPSPENSQKTMDLQNNLHNDSLSDAGLAEHAVRKGVLDDFPDGGSRAWAVAISASCVVFCTLGYTNSFGYVPPLGLTFSF